MVWQYYIPHVWNKPTTIWEDIYLVPMDKSIRSKALHLTVEAIDEDTCENHGLNQEEFRTLLRTKLPKDGYFIEDDSLTAHSKPIRLDDLFHYAKLWLGSIGYDCTEFEEVSYEAMEPFARDLLHFRDLPDDD